MMSPAVPVLSPPTPYIPDSDCPDARGWIACALASRFEADTELAPSFPAVTEPAARRLPGTQVVTQLKLFPDAIPSGPFENTPYFAPIPLTPMPPVPLAFPHTPK